MGWLEQASAHHGLRTEWVGFQRVAEVPVVMGLIGATREREMEARSDEEIVTRAVEALSAFLGPDLPSPIEHQLTRWGADPFSRGSYSYHALGSTPRMRRVLAQPLRKRLYCAGEATSEAYYGTVHGAYLTGLLQAARAILSR